MSSVVWLGVHPSHADSEVWPTAHHALDSRRSTQKTSATLIASACGAVEEPSTAWSDMHVCLLPMICFFDDKPSKKQVSEWGVAANKALQQFFHNTRPVIGDWSGCCQDSTRWTCTFVGLVSADSFFVVRTVDWLDVLGDTRRKAQKMPRVTLDVNFWQRLTRSSTFTF